MSSDERKKWSILLVVSLIFTYFLGRYLPGATAFLMGSKLYTPAFYVYDSTTVFDNTILTYGTDYMLATTHGSLCVALLLTPTSAGATKLKYAAAALVGSFALSTFSGAIAHHFLWRNLDTWYFRLVWRICVGSVGAAGGALGMCASELAKLPVEGKLRVAVPIVPDFFWKVWAMFFFAVIWSGLYSMKNPACDIFLTGVTQAPPTFYCAIVLASRVSWSNIVKEEMVYLLVFSLLVNCLLLPGYDVLNYLQLRDGICNVFLHTVLFISWTSQAVALQSFVAGAGKQSQTIKSE